MKELMVVQPDYVANFSCVGAACRDHCCKRWSITLDKQTYRKYTKSQNAEIRRIAITDISVSRASFQIGLKLSSMSMAIALIWIKINCAKYISV